MFVVFLRFSENKDMAGVHMEGHNAWLKDGFDDGVFLVAGSLKPGQGGCILAHNTTMEELQERLRDDPFVVSDIVKTEILEIAPAKTDERLQFLLD